jgi:hypothetical protein
MELVGTNSGYSRAIQGVEIEINFCFNNKY